MAKRKTNKKKNIKKVKKRKIRFGRIFLVLIILFLLFYLLANIFKFPIKNIYVKGNNILSDQEIIEIAQIENYPSILKRLKLRKNI